MPLFLSHNWSQCDYYLSCARASVSAAEVNPFDGHNDTKKRSECDNFLKLIPPRNQNFLLISRPNDFRNELLVDEIDAILIGRAPQLGPGR
jgi:hypothetical protein